MLSTFTEYPEGDGYTYGPFFGRGLMQLTWAKNYAAYGAYRRFGSHTGAYQDRRITSISLHVWDAGGDTRSWAPRFDPGIVETDLFSAGDSGGFYWVTKSFRGKNNINRVCDFGGDGKFVGYISWLVNRGANGYQERQLFFAYLINHLLDGDKINGIHEWRYPSLSPTLTATFPPGSPSNNQVVQVNYEQQVP